MNEERVDSLFSALAHPDRRRMLDLLMVAPGMSVGALSTHFEMTRIGVMKHLKVLEDADLVLSKRQGRTRHLFFNPIPIQQMHDRWTTQYSAFWSERLVDIKSRIERRAAERKDNKSA
jgi:DNA-binding transcriptional ArsR family regulator